MTSAAPTFRHAFPTIRIVQTWVRPYHKQKGFAGGWPGHGEEIWIHNHLVSGQIVYSFTRTLDSNKALRQLGFHGKKTKPTKLRKDYWYLMAMIQFPKGAGAVGRSAFQKLREFRKMHELGWGDDVRAADRQERGRLLNDQRANSIADVAAVLAGRGLGNLVALDNEAPEKPWLGAPRPDTGALYKATVYWRDADDKNYASAWSGNVAHDVLPWRPHPVELSRDRTKTAAAGGDGRGVRQKEAGPRKKVPLFVVPPVSLTPPSRGYDTWASCRDADGKPLPEEKPDKQRDVWHPPERVSGPATKDEAKAGAAAAERGDEKEKESLTGPTEPDRGQSGDNGERQAAEGASGSEEEVEEARNGEVRGRETKSKDGNGNAQDRAG